MRNTIYHSCQEILNYYTQTEMQDLFDIEGCTSRVDYQHMRLRERPLELLFWVEQYGIRNPHVGGRIDDWLDEVLQVINSYLKYAK